MKKLKASDYGPSLDTICSELAVLYKYFNWTWLNEVNPPDKNRIKKHIEGLIQDLKKSKTTNAIYCGGIKVIKSEGKQYKDCVDIIFCLDMPYYCIRVKK